MSATSFVCDSQHDGLTSKVLRSHYSHGCRDAFTRAAIMEYQHEVKARRKDAADAEAALAPGASAGGSLPLGEAVVVPAAPTSVVVAPKPAPPVADVSSVGASCRLRALTNLGYTPKTLAESTGLSADSIWWLLIAPPATIQASTHRNVTSAFDRLRTQPKSLEGLGSDGAAAMRARALAELNHWSGPYAWQNIDAPGEVPAPRGSHRDTALLTKALQEATLDPPGATPADAAAAELNRAQILLVEVAEARDGVNAELARTHAQLNAAVSAGNMARRDAADALARLETAIEAKTAALARIVDLEERLSGRSAADQLASGLDPVLVAGLGALSITVNQAGIWLTLPSMPLARWGAVS